MLLFHTGTLSAQVTPSDTANSPSVHSPKKALIMSLIVPGLGQVYNQKYWKVPIIYGAGGAFAYFIGFNQHKYVQFRDAYLKGDTGEPTLIEGIEYDYDVLPRAMNYYRRYRDLSVLGTGAIYLLNAIDAMIDAHFFSYDVSDDLSLDIRPTLLNSPDLTAEAVGLRIRIGF
jgi:hypothetical protein